MENDNDKTARHNSSLKSSLWREATYGLTWKRSPAYTTIRVTIQGTSSAEIEERFRQCSDFLAGGDTAQRLIAFDGKVLHIFAKLRSFAINILRANNVENVSLELFNNCMNLYNILNYAGVM